MITYPGGRQDVGIWNGSRMVQLKYPQVEADFKLEVQGSSSVSLKSPDYSLRGTFGSKGYLEVLSHDPFT